MVEIMGVLNVTPDSFSDGGNFFKPSLAISHAKKLLEDGVDIVDVGGQSTRPGFIAITDSEEENRVKPVLEFVTSKEFAIPISVDTYYPKVASLAARFGAKIINDPFGYNAAEMLNIVKEFSMAYVVNHYGGSNLTKSFFENKIELAEKMGVSRSRIILDPGIGFGKTFLDDINSISNLEEFKGFGGRLLVGVSRKRVARVILDILNDSSSNISIITEQVVNKHENYVNNAEIKSFVKSKLFGNIRKLFAFFTELGLTGETTGGDFRDVVTGILNIISVKNGADIVRVHNVKLTKLMLNKVKNFKGWL